jgi:hypothetical protein
MAREIGLDSITANDPLRVRARVSRDEISLGCLDGHLELPEDEQDGDLCHGFIRRRVSMGTASVGRG